jgi:hypothetical protein
VANCRIWEFGSAPWERMKIIGVCLVLSAYTSYIDVGGTWTYCFPIASSINWITPNPTFSSRNALISRSLCQLVIYSL